MKRFDLLAESGRTSCPDKGVRLINGRQDGDGCSDIFDRLAMSWGSPLVARHEVGRFSGGLLNPRTLANLDVKGEVPGKIVIGNRVAYDVELLIKWLRDRCKETSRAA